MDHRVGADHLDGATTGECFRAYVTDFLVPTLKPGDPVILDNFGAHRRRVCGRHSGSSGPVAYLLPYPLDFNPIERGFAKLKALSRQAAARTVPESRTPIRRTLSAFAPHECCIYLNTAGCDAYDPI